ncbi:MAG: GNAT family N-acetyltransferase [Clostridia bacterium]
MSLEVKKVKLSNKDVKRVYVDSFSKEERMPFSIMIFLTKITHTDFLAFYDKNTLCGFVYSATIKNITFIMFFAVDKNIRSKGYGSKILEEMQRLYPKNKIVISIERCDVEATNINDRIRRKNFYLKNGYIDTGYLIELSKIEQEIIIKNGTFDKDELFNFFVKYSNGTMKPKIWKK